MSLTDQLNLFRESYADSITSRAVVQTIPVVGGALDTIMAGYGTQIQQERFYRLLDILTRRMDEIEGVNPIEATEEFLDLIRVAVENSVRTRSDIKRERFANIIANTVISDIKPWDEAETVMKLLGELEDIHVEILFKIVKTPACQRSSFEGMKVARLLPSSESISDSQFLMLFEEFEQYSPWKIQLACSELLSKGLLLDEGTNRIGVGSMELLILTDTSKWLIEWLRSN